MSISGLIGVVGGMLLVLGVCASIGCQTSTDIWVGRGLAAGGVVLALVAIIVL